MKQASGSGLLKQWAAFSEQKTPGVDAMFRFRRKDSDFDEEVRAHLELEADRLIAEGASPEEARNAARQAFGNVLVTRERYRETNRLLWLEQFAQDMRYAWRGLWRSRAFVANTVLTLALGLGLVTVIFAVFNTYVLRPFSVRDPYSLYRISWRSQNAGGAQFSWNEYREISDYRDLFDSAIAERSKLVSFGGNSLLAAFISSNYFETLAPRVLLGRTLADFDFKNDANHRVAVLSYQAWTRLFDKDPTVLGRNLDISGHTVTILGVLRPEFSSLDGVPRDVWLPLAMYPDITGTDLFGPKQPRDLNIVVRLRPGITAEQTQAALTPLMARIVDKRDVRAEVQLNATPSPISFELIETLSPVFAAFALVLIAACTNVSNVMLARANARYREIAVRLSVGASRGRVVRQLLTEGLLIAILAGVAGLAFAAVALPTSATLFVAALPASLGALVRVAPLDFDHRVFLFALTTAAITTILFALLPALQATRLTLTDSLRGQPGGNLQGSTLRNVLVISQVTVSLILLVVAATFLRNGAAIEATDLGFDRNNVVSIEQQADGNSLVARSAEIIAADPHIEEVAITSERPLSEILRKIAVTTRQGTNTIVMPYTFVSESYFSVLRIPIIRGRGFLREEALSEARVAIVSAATAKTLWPAEDPIGKIVHIEHSANQATDHLANYSAVIIVGVAKDVVSGLMFDNTDQARIYLPTSATGRHAPKLLVRGRSSHDLHLLHSLLRQVHPDPFAFEIFTLDELFAMQMFPIRIASWIGSFLAAVALGLSLSGLYSVLTYTLSQRTKEIGIRMALGATASAVMRLVMLQSVRLAGYGAIFGLICAFGAMKAISAIIQLRNMTLIDVSSFAVSLVLVIAAAVLAAYFPARRAARLDPTQTLRADG